MSRPPRYQASTLTRAFDILESFSPRTPTQSLSDIAARAGLPLSTTSRLAAVLQQRGYLERVTGSDNYRVGIRAFELGNLYIQSTSLESEAQPILRTLAKTCNQTANLGIRDGQHIVHIAVVPPDRPIRFWARVGQREDIHCTGLGKALLSGLTDDEVSELLKNAVFTIRTEKTIGTLRDLVQQLQVIRQRGSATDDEESVSGLTCIAAPIHDHRGEVVAAVSVSGPTVEFDQDVTPVWTEAVVEAAREISLRLGHGIFDTENAVSEQEQPIASTVPGP